MTIAFLRDHCLSLPGVTEDTPFDPTTICFRVGGKIFAITDLENFEYVNLKCDPERSAELRERYPGITPGYHMNKKLWNSVSVRGTVPDVLILELTELSYRLIRDALPLKIRQTLS